MKAVTNKTVKKTRDSALNVITLRSVARSVLTLYRKVAASRRYAERLSKAIRTEGDVEGIIRETVRVQGIETAKVGFFLCFGFPGPELCSGTILRSANKPFRASRFRSVAMAVVPLYEKIVNDRRFALRLVRAARAGNACRTLRLVRSVIRTPLLYSVTANAGELRLFFRFPDRSRYENSFFG